MHDILIRGLDMPDGCHHCRFSYLDNGETNDGEPCSVIMCSAMEQGTNGAEYDGNRPSWCPLVPLPEGHGKLIDIEDVKSGKFHIEGRAEMYSAYNIGWNDALDAVCMNAPSIVPAEGGTDDEHV